ncbi:MAG: flavoprotein [Leptospirales bacterium]
MKILLGVTGSVACYKALDLTRLFAKNGHDVQVIMSKTAAGWISPVLFGALCGNDALTDEDYYSSGMLHIDLCRDRDAFVIAPATANIIAQCAHGLAPSLITSSYLYFPGTTWFAPAMNPNMYDHPTVQTNIRHLMEHGCEILEPAEGVVACGDKGRGKLMDVNEIYTRVVGKPPEK